jgi:hypothetical protein
MLKKTTVAVLGLATSGLTFAGSMGPVCTPGAITVPCEAKQWSFGVDALYLKAVTSGARAYRANVLGGLSELDNDWNWGFRAEAAYQYGTGNDVSVSWMHYNDSAQQSDLVGLLITSVAPLALSVLPTTVNVQNRLDQVNAVLGQHVDASVTNKVRFYAGMQYASIEHNTTNYYGSGAIPGVFAFSAATRYDDNDFTGFGPVLGIDYSYYVSPQISLIADGATALLYGTTRLTSGFVYSPANAVLGTNYASKKTTVPAFEAKLAVNYAHAMPQGSLNLQGGYRVVDYFNALQSRALPTSPVTTADYTLYGPYVGLKYVGNV